MRRGTTFSISRLGGAASLRSRTSKDAAMKAAGRAAPASLVAGAIEHALTSPRPKTRYLVGFDAKIRALLSAMLPDRLQDRLLTWAIKLPPRT